MIEQRKARRFDLRLPFELLRIGSVRTSQVSETRNVSSVGVLFVSDASFVVGDPIEYMIALPTGRNGNTLSIRCLGKVVRVGAGEHAATLERYEFVRTNKLGGVDPTSSSAGKSGPRRRAAGS